MSLVPSRLAASIVALVVILGAIGPGAALAQQGKITQRDCSQGRIHDRSGKAIATTRCQRLVGKSVTLAPTGFNVWIVGLGGFVCLAGAAALRRSARAVPDTA